MSIDERNNTVSYMKLNNILNGEENNTTSFTGDELGN